MFLKNKYNICYYKLIKSRKKLNRIFSKKYQKHHITPKSLGGSDINENVILLTPREHYICHLLLLEMTKGKDRSKMFFAFFRFNNDIYTSSRSYENFIKHYSQSISGKNNPFYGRKHSQETKEKISKKGKGRKYCYDIWTEKYGKEIADIKNKQMLEKRNFSGEKHPFFGKKHSKETIEKMQNARKGKKPNLGKKHSEKTKKLYSIMRTGKNNPNFGKKRTWINNHIENKCVLELELEKFLDKGWEQGRK